MTVVIVLVSISAAFFLMIIIKLYSNSRKINNLIERLLGSATKGQVSENVLEEVMKPFLEAQLVVHNLPIDGGNSTVEFAIELEKGIYCAVDQKTSGKARPDIEDVSRKYVNKLNTTFFGILAAPESVYDRYIKEKDYALGVGVIVARDDDLRFLVPLLIRIYNNFRLSKNTREINKQLSTYRALRAELEKIYFSMDSQYEKFKIRFRAFLSAE